MKHNVLIIAISLLSIVSLAQKTNFKPIIGINTILVGKANNWNKAPIEIGFNIGFLLEKNINKSISFETALIFSKNYKKYERLFILPYEDPFGQIIPIKDFIRLNYINIPITVLFRDNLNKSLQFGIGGIAKYAIQSNRVGISAYDLNYKDKLALKTKAGNKVGFGILTTVKKEFKINKKLVDMRLNYNFDITNWQYPTNLMNERKMTFDFKSHNFSLFFSFAL